MSKRVRESKTKVNEDISGVKGLYAGSFYCCSSAAQVIVFSILKRTNSLSLINSVRLFMSFALLYVLIAVYYFYLF